jgi:hypothetical protein
MKLTVDLENLESIVKTTIETNVENIVKREVDDLIKKEIADTASEVVSEVVNKNLQEFVQEYIKTTPIKIGGGLYSKEPEQVYTIEEYTRKTLAEMLESKMFITETRDSWSGRTEKHKVSFSDYITNQLKYDDMIQKHLDGFATSMKNDVTKKIKDTFDSATRNALSESVFNVLMSTDTYQKIVSNVNMLASGK